MATYEKYVHILNVISHLYQLKCFHKRTHTGMDSIFRCQFPSAIVNDNLRLVYVKSELDDAFKDKRFTEDIKVELLFDKACNMEGSGERVV